MSKYTIGSYKVPVKNAKSIVCMATIEIAKEEDMPTDSQWNFCWQNIWKTTNFKYQQIIKISYNLSVLGLLRYAVYEDEEDKPYLLEVLHLESAPKDLKLVEPLGKWLIWYAVQTALVFCTLGDDDTLVTLDSVEEAITYYEDIIKMEPRGWVTLAPGEYGYAFRFIKSEAQNFCQRQTNTYGQPESIQS